ncbi:hypothetical protein LINGRAHAP2_LOCUS20082 [Linum grandiflorum]
MMSSSRRQELEIGKSNTPGGCESESGGIRVGNRNMQSGIGKKQVPSFVNDTYCSTFFLFDWWTLQFVCCQRARQKIRVLGQLVPGMIRDKVENGRKECGIYLLN